MKDSNNNKIEFDTSRFSVLPSSFMFFTPEEQANWFAETNQKNMKAMYTLSQYKGDGIIISSSQIHDMDRNFADIFNKYYSGKKVLVDIFQGNSFSTEDFDKIVEVYDKLTDGNNELYFYEGATVYSVGEVFLANSKINLWVDEINSKKINGKPLSPLEKFYLAYDIVTDFEFNESESIFDARNLISVLQGNKIVCVGFAKLLSELCKRVGIECEVQLVAHKSDKPNHMNCIVRLKDDKYGVDGVFYSDPCWDSAKKGRKSFEHFLLTYKELPFLFGNKLKVAPNTNTMNNLVVDDKFKDLKTREDWQKLMKDFILAGKDDFLNFINSSSERIDFATNPKNPSKDELQEIIELYISGVYSMKKLSKKYADNKNILGSFGEIDFVHRSVIDQLIGSYTTKENFDEFKQLLFTELDNFMPNVASKTFDDLRKVYELDENQKNGDLVEKMKNNTRHLEFNQFIKLTKNLAKLYPGHEKDVEEYFYSLMRTSLAKAIGSWKRPADGINPVSKLAYVYQNRRSVHPVPVAKYIDDYYDKVFDFERLVKQASDEDKKAVQEAFNAVAESNQPSQE